METCCICGSPVKPATDEAFRCTHCGVVRTIYEYDPLLYRGKYARNYANYAQTEINTPLNLFRLGLISRWLRKGQRLLDVGCCVGEFVRFAEQHYMCLGFEPNRVAAKMARTKCASKIHTELNGTFGKAHLITMFDVIEHIEEPGDFLNLLANEYLVPDGFLVIVTPNADAISNWNQDALEAWKHYKPKEHLFLYTETGLEKLLHDHGFGTVHWGQEESDIRPGNPNGDIMTCVARRVYE